MVRVTVGRGEAGCPMWFKVTGHARHGTYGNDIVCAATSVLAQTTVMALEEILDLAVEVKTKAGLLECRLPADCGERLPQVKLLVETMLLGLSAIARDYPGTVEIHEV